MADLIEIGVSFVDKGDGMKKAVSTVERLEAKMIKLIKAQNLGTISTDRFHKAMVIAGRELKKNSDFTGLNAYNSIQKYVAAKKRSIQAEQDSAKAIAAEALALKSNKAALDAQRTSTKANTAALNSFRTQTDAVYRAEQKLLSLKKLLRTEVANNNMTMREAAAVQMQYKRSLDTMGGGLQQTKNKMSSMGVVTQQAGYQLGDFIVQVQGGQSAFIAFSQQATQMVGFLPLMAARLGITTAAAVGLSAALGIGIPIVSSLAMVFFTMSKSSKDAAESVDALKEAQEGLNTATGDYANKLDQLRFGVDTSEEATVLREIADLRRIDADLKARYLATDSLGTRQRLAEEALLNKAKMSGLQAQADALAEIRGEYETQKALSEGQIAAREKFNALLRDRQKLDWENMQAAKADIVTMQRANDLKAIEIKHGQDSLEYINEQHRVGRLLLEQRIEEERLSEGLADNLREGLGLAQAFELVDMGAGIRAAERDTQDLITRLTKAVNLASILDTVKGGKTYSGRGSSEGAGATAGEKALLSMGGEYIPYKDKTGSKGGGGSKFDADEYLAGLIKEAKLKTSLIGLSEQEIAKKTLLHTLEEKGINLNDDRVKVLIQEQKSLDELQKAYDKQQEMVGMFKNTITNALTSIIDGSKSVAGAFKDMLRQMLTSLAQSKFIQPLVAGMSAGFAGTAASAGTSAAVGGATGGMMAGIGATVGTAGAALVGGGMSAFGMTAASGGAIATGMAAMPALAAIGAVAAPLLAVAAVFSFFKKKTKELDSGLNVTVKNMDTFVESFSKVQTSKFWGMSKSESTTTSAASDVVANPIIAAVSEIQNQVVKAADALGIASDAFEGFSHEFKVSLKGLTEEQAMAKINEELVKMGDSFASMTGLFSTMNELLAVTQQRMDLETKLLNMQGNVVELRKQELDAVHILNKGLAARIQLLEAEADMSSALAAFASGISQQQGIIKSAVDALIEPLLEAINKVKTQAEASYKIFSEAADKTRVEAKTIVDLLRGALDARTIKSEGLELMRYKQAQRQLTAFAGGASFDQASLSKATEGVSIDSQKFFGSFEDYARDFYKTQINLEQLEKKASEQLTDVEKQIELAEKAYETAMGTYEEAVDTNTALKTLLEDLAAYTEVAARNEPFIDQIKAEGDRQVELLDQILKETTLQVNAALGLTSSVADLVGSNISVGEAIEVLGLSGEELLAAVTALDNPVAEIGININNLNNTIGAALGGLGSTVSSLYGGFNGLVNSNNNLIAAINAAAAASAASAGAAASAGGGATASGPKTITIVSTFGGGLGGASGVVLSDGRTFKTGKGIGNAAEIRNAKAMARAAIIKDGNIPGFANGGMHSGGLRLVGENGPEIEATGPSRIYSNQQTKGLMSNDGSSETVAELRMLRQEISEMKAEQRKIGVENVKYNKKSYDLNRQWDVVGLPATRTS